MMLCLADSALKMPDINGSAILSSASAPKRRRTNAAKVSSLSSRLAGIIKSNAMRSLPNGEINGDMANGKNLVGTISDTPSGKGNNLPRCKTYVACLG